MKYLILLLVSQGAMAAGSGEGNPLDLWMPALNLSILLAIIFSAIKKPAREYFATKSSEVSEMVERAAIKAKEAQMMMETQKKKIEGAEAEIQKLKEDAVTEMSSFETNYKKEVEERIQKLKEDATMKIEAEKKELIDELNSGLLDQVIANAKNKIKNDNNLSKEAAAKILEGLK